MIQAPNLYSFWDNYLADKFKMPYGQRAITPEKINGIF